MIKRAVIMLIAVLCILPLGAQEQSSSQQGTSQSGQQNQKQKQSPKQAPADQNKPKPLFGGTVSAKSSSQNKDTTSLGFNGLDPEGKVQKAMLNSSPTSEDEKKVEKITAEKVDAAELKQFIDEGHLKSKGNGGGQ